MQALGLALAGLVPLLAHGAPCQGSDERCVDPATGLLGPCPRESSVSVLERGALHSSMLDRRQRLELGRAAFRVHLRDQMGTPPRWGEPDENQQLAKVALNGIKSIARSYVQRHLDPLRGRVRSRVVDKASERAERPARPFGLDLSTSLRLGRDPQVGARFCPRWERSPALSALEVEIRKGLRRDLLALGLRWRHGRSRVWVGHRLRDDRHGREIELSVRIVL